MPSHSRRGGGSSRWNLKGGSSSNNVFAASGAGAAGPEDTCLDIGLAQRWVGFRAKFPFRRGAAVVGPRRVGRPTPSEQEQFHHYRTRRPDGAVDQEWWLAPFLVKLGSELAEKGDLEGPEEAHALKKFRADPAQGVPCASEHFTNIHRILGLAREHPMVQEPFLHKADRPRTSRY